MDIASVIIKLQFFKILLKIDIGSTSNLNSKVQLKSLLRKNFKEITILIIESGRRSIGPGHRSISSLSLVEYYCMQMGDRLGIVRTQHSLIGVENKIAAYCLIPEQRKQRREGL